MIISDGDRVVSTECLLKSEIKSARTDVRSNHCLCQVETSAIDRVFMKSKPMAREL